MSENIPLRVKSDDGVKPTCPMVAIVIPAYNAMRYLPKALESVLAQTYQNFEVIIINDGSQDHIESWYSELSPEIKRQVQLFSQENQGISSARNTGICRSQSPYVAFLDADDIWLPHKLERQIQYLEAHPSVSLTYSWAAAVDSQGQLIGRIYAAEKGVEKVTGKSAGKSAGKQCLDTHTPIPQMWSQLVTNNVISTTSTVLVRRACLVSVGLFDLDLISYVEDKDLWLRIARAHIVQVIPEVMIHKRRHSANTSKQWQAMEQASYQVLSKAFARPPNGLNQRQLQRLKRKSYGETNLKLAWKPLQTDEVNMKVALNYAMKALGHCPTLIVSRECLKLICVIVLLTLLGTRLYRLSLRKVSNLRYWRSKSRVGDML